MAETAGGVTDNADKSRFELLENGDLAFADYRRQDGAVVLPHVEAAHALRGTGAASRLMEGVVVQLRQKGVKAIPRCGYAVAWFKRHPEHSDLLA
ncbi:MAG: GNAT family N-acetyltransferase [Caulobacteraceae bacterium]